MKDSSGEIFHKTSSAPGISAYAQKGPDGTWRVFSKLYDQRGDTTALVNHLGTLVMTQSYADYGAQKNSPSIPYGFLGSYARLHISQTGLDLLGARYYNPHLGRFLSKDPIEGGSANAYEYGGGDPINKVDPKGTYFFGVGLGYYYYLAYLLSCLFQGCPTARDIPAPLGSQATVRYYPKRNSSTPTPAPARFGDPSGFRFDWSAAWDAGRRGLKAIVISAINPAAGSGAVLGAARGKDIDVGEALGAGWDKTYEYCFAPASAAVWGGSAGVSRALGSSFRSSGKVYVVTCATIFSGGVLGDVWGQALA
jgi:RHS repeat-associated protein